MKTSSLFVAPISIIAAAFVLSGCTTFEGKYDHSEGWHPARVVEVAPFSALAKDYGSTCSVSGASASGRTGAIVGYQGGSGWRNQLMLLPENASYKAGDLVYANVLKCDEPLVARERD